MGSDRRIRRVVNVNFQKALALRMVGHAVLFVWSVSLICLGLLVVTGELQTDESLERIRSVCLRAIGFSMIIILPAIVYDSIRFSHRMAGPITRLKNVLPQIGVERVELIQLRKNDFWKEFIADVNQMLERVEALRQSADKNAGSELGVLSVPNASSSHCGDSGIALCEASAQG